ncbi:MAG: hypothetical protein JW956_09340, partial [Calditrichaceae bacterium]|nr:hypothetical protein [Calditrichaceae bacterium]
MKLKHKFFYRLESKINTFSDEQGSAIVFVIVFITIVLFFISIVLLHNHYQYLSIINYGNDIQTYYNARSAVLLTLQQQNLDKQQLDYPYRQFKYHLTNSDTTIVDVEPYGMYSKYQSISKIKRSKSERTFIIGRESDDRFRKALVIGDTRNPVIVTGKTSIKGDVLVGPQGVKPGVIRGIGFKGERIVEGGIEKDIKSGLPSLYVQSLFEQRSRLQNLASMDYNQFSISGRKLYLKNQNLSLNQD